VALHLLTGAAGAAADEVAGDCPVASPLGVLLEGWARGSISRKNALFC